MCFSLFKNCTNDNKLRKASHMFAINNKDIRTTHYKTECNQVICTTTQMIASYMMESHSGVFIANYRHVKQVNLASLR